MNTRRKAALILWLPVVGAFLLLLADPETASGGARQGVSQCLQTVLPALYPFLVLTGLLLRLPPLRGGGGFAGRLFRRWFRLPEEALPVFLLGLVCGCPAGAAAAAQQYTAGSLSKADAERLIPLCNICGPGFLLGVVGAQVFQNPTLGLKLLLLQLCCAFWLAALHGIGQPLPPVSAGSSPRPRYSFSRAFTESVCGGGSAVLRVCAYVVFFSAVTAFLPEIPLLRGIMELTAGISEMQGADWKTVAGTAFLLGFGGLSAGFQVLSVAENAGLTVHGYLRIKLMFGFLFAAMAVLVLESGWFLLLPPLCCVLTGKIADMVEKQV